MQGGDVPNWSIGLAYDRSVWSITPSRPYEDFFAGKERSMRYAALVVGVLVLGWPGAVRAQPAAEKEPLAEQVRQSIDKGIKFLLQKQNQIDGDWEVEGIAPIVIKGGTTSLVMLALLTANVPKAH